MDHQLYISLLYILPASLLVVSALWMIFVPLRGFRKVRSAFTPTDSSGDFQDVPVPEESPVPEEESSGPDASPALSVIAYCENSEESIGRFLEATASQTFRDFEVIVVTDSGMEASALLAERFRDRRDVSFTFIPPDTHNLSRRKLAYTLGIKRAKGRVVLTTVTNIGDVSPRWLEEMMRPFDDSWVQVVTGYSHPDFSEFPRRLRDWTRFQELSESVEWLAPALSGNVIRGDGHNLAFLRELFFRNNGYAATNHLVGGDDDLFVHSIADNGNSAVALSGDAILTVEWGHSAPRMLRDLRERHRFDARFLPRWPRLEAGSLGLCSWILLLSAVALTVAFSIETPVGWLGLGTVWLLTTLTWLAQALTVSRASVILQSRLSGWFIPFMLLWRPFAGLRSRLGSRRRLNYTWRR